MFRVGLWLDYGRVLRADSGLGVFVRELVRGFLGLEEPLEITLLTRPGDGREMTALVGGPHPRLTVSSHAHGEPSLSFEEARGCDAWLFPSPAMVRPSDVPTVLCLHDDLPALLGHELDRPSVDLIESDEPSLSRLIASATACVCTSATIRDGFARGRLGISSARSRLVPLAVPSDLARPPGAALPAGLDREYIFWPAAFRQTKNHARLVAALHLLRDRYGESRFDLVFTGGPGDDLPEVLRQRIESCGLTPHVRALGCVSRDTLAALYRSASVTIIGSAFAQGPLPVYEALRAGSPVACAALPALRECCATLGDAMPYFDPLDPDAIARTLVVVRDQRPSILARQQAASEALWRRTWSDVAGEVLGVCKEAAAVARLPRAEQVRRCARPWQEGPITVRPPLGPPELFLFLPVVYPGGIWQATKDLLTDLIAINKERRDLALSFALPDDEGDAGVLAELRRLVTVDRFELAPITKAEGARLLGPAGVAGLRDEVYLFMKGCAQLALRADAWFALADRFRFPLLPARPYGVLVYDMIQSHAPETFPSRFFEWVERGMKPTMERAAMVLTTSESTRKDVLAGYSLDPERVRMASIASAPGRRFAGLAAERVAVPREPFLLQVTNIAPHKGAKVMLRAHARLKQRLGDRAPLLVMCGFGTELLAPSCKERAEDPTLRETRKLVVQLGLQENRDVLFLGFLRDAQLLDLYQRAAVVVNAARYDNGTLCAIEGHYFGRPVVSSRYAAAEEMCRRFELPVSFFEVEDDAGLAEQLAVALERRPLAGAELAQVRQGLEQPRFTHRHYAELVYGHLVELAWSGRNRRAAGQV